eukprot:Gb_15873 [translate_table: standard]
MEVASNLANSVICGIFNKACEETKNIIHLGRDAAAMQSLLCALNARKEDIKDHLQRQERIALRAVQNWLDEIESTKEIAECIQRDYDLHKSCLGFCLHCSFSLNLSRRIRSCTTLIQRLSQEGKFENLNEEFAQLPSLPRTQPRPLPHNIVGDAIREAQSQIEEWCINDCKTGVFAVYVELTDGRCKIVLSTRSKQVSRAMNAHHMLKMVPLTQDESWQLFCRRAFGNDQTVIPTEEIRDIARQICGECAGLPLAINAVAAAMPDLTDQRAWGSVLTQLKTVDFTFYDINNFFSYPELFLRTMIAEGLVDGEEYDSLIDKGYNFINALRDRCLIEATKNKWSGKIYWITLHDVIHDLAVLIAEKEENSLFRSAQNLVRSPVVKESECFKRISLMNNKIESLPTNFRCPTLVTLMLSGNKGIEEVPESFLLNLPSLKVLNLNRTGIRSLPTSLGLLCKELVHLQLSKTGIEELPESLGYLSRLQFLYLDYCRKLRCLPLTIGKLQYLSALYLNGCKKLSVLPSEIAQLTSLKHLRMYRSDIYVGDESSFSAWADQKERICLKDVGKLRGLRELGIQINSPLREEHLPEDMQKMVELEEFSIVGCDVVGFPRWISGFQNLYMLHFNRCKKLKELCGLEMLPRLRVLHIDGCTQLKELGFGRCNGFPMLRMLWLSDLPSLQRIVEAEQATSWRGGVLEEGSMPNLKRLIVVQCPSLKELPLGMEKMKSLETLDAEEKWWDEIDCKDENMRKHLQSIYQEWQYTARIHKYNVLYA